ATAMPPPSSQAAAAASVGEAWRGVAAVMGGGGSPGLSGTGGRPGRGIRGGREFLPGAGTGLRARNFSELACVGDPEPCVDPARQDDTASALGSKAVGQIGAPACLVVQQGRTVT